jgi:hypothetical protein
MAPAGPTYIADSSTGGVGRGISTGAYAACAVTLSVKSKVVPNITVFIAHSVISGRAIACAKRRSGFGHDIRVRVLRCVHSPRARL